MKHFLIAISIIIFLGISSSCSGQINQNPDGKSLFNKAENLGTPTIDCSTFYDSSIFPPTSTPTYLKTTNESKNIDVIVKRDIEYETERLRCLDILSSDVELSITKDYATYQISIVDVVNKSERFSGSDDVGGNYIREIEVIYIKDLDIDGEDEIVVYIHTRGASCCTGLVVFYWDENKSEYLASNIIWRKYSLALKIEDSNDDGTFEFVTRDLWSPALIRYCTACSGISPIEIYQFINGELVNVTIDYPNRIEQDAIEWLERYDLGATSEDGYQIEYLGVYLSDMYLSGNEMTGNQVFDEKCNPLLGVQECEDYKRIVVERISDPNFGDN